MLTLNELAYTVQPRPQVGKVDLAGAFLNTDRFIAENVLFSKQFLLLSFLSLSNVFVGICGSGTSIM